MSFKFLLQCIILYLGSATESVLLPSSCAIGFIVITSVPGHTMGALSGEKQLMDLNIKATLEALQQGEAEKS